MSQKEADASDPKLSETVDADSPAPGRNLLDVLADLGDLPVERQRQRLDELALPPNERQQVQKWLAARGQTPGFLEEPPAEARQMMARLPISEPAAMPASVVPKNIGPYRILEPIGQGGMGTVYKAEQRTPVKRI